MQVQIDIGFDQLISIIRSLPASQLEKLRQLIIDVKPTQQISELESLLLNGPVATADEIAVIEQNIKTINQWRMS